MPINYSTYVSQIANLTIISSNDVNFQTMLPGMIEYAENRIYREADLLATYITDSSTNVVANQRTFSYPTGTGTFLVIDQINIWTPITATSSNATRVPLEVASRQFVDQLYPNDSSGTGVPKYFSPAAATFATLAPVPDQNYKVEVIGTQRPVPLSSANSSTYLTQNFSDLFTAASMVFASGYMKNFSAQGDDQQMAVSWETQYNKLFASAGMEELRKKYAGQAWQNRIPNPIATPPRV